MPTREYLIVMAADDATLAQIRRWIRRVRRTVLSVPTTNAVRARAWRDRRRGRPPRPFTNFDYDIVCAAGGHPLTPENVRVTNRGVRLCRTCQNARIRTWRHQHRPR